MEVFRGHYAHGTTAHVLAARAVNAAQDKVFEKARTHPVFLDAAAESRLADPEVAGAAGAERRAGRRDGCRAARHGPDELP